MKVLAWGVAPGSDLGVSIDDGVAMSVAGRAGVTGVLVRHGGGHRCST